MGDKIMRLNSLQFQKQEQKQKATQKMLQSLHVLAMSQAELKAYMQEAYESNPLLDITESALQGNVGPSGMAADASMHGRDAELYATESAVQTFAEYLYEQLMFLPNMDDEQRMLCKYLILCLNHKGYLETSLDELALRVGKTTETMEQALFQLQKLEPAGVGARTLGECLRLQAERDSEAGDAVFRLLREENLQLIENADAAAKALQCPLEEARKAILRVKSYHPYPSEGFSDGTPIVYCIPEAEVTVEQGRLQIRLNRRFLPRLVMNEGTAKLLSQGTKEEKAYYKECNKKAEEVLEAIGGREHTIRLLLEFIVGRQKEYFLLGKPLQALTMGEAAEAIGVHPSTVSRGVKEKYLLFQGRNIPLKDFFVSKLQGGRSSDEVKQKIKSLIASEHINQPYGDEQLRLMLEEEGIQVSRRAIAKYRNELNIPAAHSRKGMKKRG